MPTLDVLNGIRFYILRERGVSHHKPHIHVEYGDFAAVYDFDGNKLAGSDFPREVIWEQLQLGKTPNKLKK